MATPSNPFMTELGRSARGLGQRLAGFGRGIVGAPSAAQSASDAFAVGLLEPEGVNFPVQTQQAEEEAGGPLRSQITTDEEAGPLRSQITQDPLALIRARRQGRPSLASLDQGVYRGAPDPMLASDAAAVGEIQPGSERFLRSGGGAPTLADLEGRLRTRRLLNSIDQADAQGRAVRDAESDPMRRSIAARQQQLQYERLLPAGTSSRIRLSTGQNAPTSVQGLPDEPLGGATAGEVLDLGTFVARQRGAQSPQEQRVMSQEEERARATQAMEALRAILRDEKADPKETDEAMERFMSYVLNRQALREGRVGTLNPQDY